MINVFRSCGILWDIDHLTHYIKNWWNVNIEDNNWNTLLHHACKWWHLKIVKILIKNWCNINERNNMWLTCLYLLKNSDLANEPIDIINYMKYCWILLYYKNSCNFNF